MAMRITKFFRKYNKAILAVFTVGLMVAFLVPTTLRDFFQQNPAKRVVGEAFGKNIRQSDLARAYQGREILEILNRYLAGAAENQRQQNQPFNAEVFLQFSPENQRVMNYYLLIQEARRLGIDISNDQVDRMLVERQVPAELINNLVGSQQISLNDLRRAIADYLAVEQSLELAISAVKVSDPEMQAYYKQTRDMMKAEIIPVAAADLVKQIPAPSDKDLTAYYDQNKAKFEYPNRVQVEYLEADVPQIKDGITISREYAKQYWQDHQAEYTTTTVPATKPTTGPASQPAPVQVPMTMEQALPKVIDKLKTEKARELAKKAMYELRDQADRPWQQVTADNVTGIKPHPAAVADYQKLADQYSKKFKIKIVYHRTPLISQDEASEQPGIGRSMIPEGRSYLTFGDYAFRIAPFYQPPAKKTYAAEKLFLTLDQNNSGLMKQMAGYNDEQGYYLFRVTKADPKHLPASMAEVKDKVVKDYQLTQAYTLAKKDAEKLSQAAGKETLSQLIKTPPADVKSIVTRLGIKSIEPDTFSRRNFSYGGRLNPPMIAQVRGDTGKFADTAFEKLWKQPTTQPSGVRTCTVISSDEDRVAYVVQLEEKKPATVEDFKQFKTYLARIILMGRQQEFVRGWLSPEAIHQRTKYSSPNAVEEDQG